jgi:hypothetical protein
MEPCALRGAPRIDKVDTREENLFRIFSSQQMKAASAAFICFWGRRIRIICTTQKRKYFLFDGLIFPVKCDILHTCPVYSNIWRVVGQKKEKIF